MNILYIDNPCPENWDNMENSPQGKFCEKCSKCIVDFTDKTDDQIQDIFNAAKGKEICGRILSTSFSKIAAGIILVTNLTVVHAQMANDSDTLTEQNITDITKISGRLIFEETQKAIPNAEVIFIAKNKLLQTMTNQNGYFFLKIPDHLIKEKNVLYFDFNKINDLKIERKTQDTLSYGYENQAIVFLKEEKIENKKFEIGSSSYEIGAVVIVTPQPPDYYYFNGQDISKEKFDQLRKDHPQYRYLYFEGQAAEATAGESFIDTVYLLYSSQTRYY